MMSPEFTVQMESLQHFTSEQLMHRTQEKSDECRKFIPYKNSSWKKHTQTFLGSHKQGNLLRATMLSGGTVYTPFREHSSLLEHKVKDLKKGVIFTDVEWAHNCEGIRLFVELDYKTTEKLPTEVEVLSHLKHISEVVQECFPTLRPHQHRMHVATCEPTGITKQAKCNNDDQDIYEQMFNMVIYKKWGIHVVFPDIVTTTQVMRRIAHAVDTRISRDSAIWNDVVDSNAYKEANATLRPPFSYKSSACPVCRSVSLKKRKRKSSDDKDDSNIKIQTAHEILSNTCDCVFGYRLQPSTYSYIGTLYGSNTFATELLTMYDILAGMSIIPSSIGNFSEPFTPCTDMGSLNDKLPINGQSYKTEKQILSATSRRKQIGIPINEKQKCYQTVQNIINRIDPKYCRVVVENIKHCSSKQKNEFFITVKGPGMRWCVLRNKEHQSNRAFFILCLRKMRLYARCLDKSCRKSIIDNVPNNVFPLHAHEIIKLKELPSTNIHIVQRKISSHSHKETVKLQPQTESSSKEKNSLQSATERYIALKKTLEHMTNNSKNM